MDPIKQALVDSQRSYMNAKAAVGQSADSLLAQSGSGLPFDQRTDLSNATEQLRHFRGWVYSSVRPIAQKIAGQAIHVGREVKPKTTKGQTTSFKPFDNHELLDLLRDPNDLQVAWSLMFVTVASLELTGRQLWYLPDKKQILPIPTPWLKGFDGGSKITSFRVQPPGVAEPMNLPADQCCYFCYPNPGDPHGAISPLQAVGGAVDSDEAIETSRLSMFRKGIYPSHAIIVGKNSESGLRPRLTDTQQRQIVNAVLKRYSGVAKSGEPIVLDGLIEDVKRLSLTAEEMSFLDSEKSTKSRIMQGFGTNPIICGEIEGANRASSMASEEHFAAYTISPKIELLSQTMTEWLSPMFGGDIKIWITPVSVRDPEMTFKWAQLLSQSGSIAPNELRALAPFELAEMPELDGHVVTASAAGVGGVAHTLSTALEDLVDERVAGGVADRPLTSVESGNGNGRF